MAGSTALEDAYDTRTAGHASMYTIMAADLVTSVGELAMDYASTEGLADADSPVLHPGDALLWAQSDPVPAATETPLSPASLETDCIIQDSKKPRGGPSQSISAKIKAKTNQVLRLQPIPTTETDPDLEHERLVQLRMLSSPELNQAMGTARLDAMLAKRRVERMQKFTDLAFSQAKGNGRLEQLQDCTATAFSHESPAFEGHGIGFNGAASGKSQKMGTAGAMERYWLNMTTVEHMTDLRASWLMPAKSMPSLPVTSPLKMSPAVNNASALKPIEVLRKAALAAADALPEMRRHHKQRKDKSRSKTQPLKAPVELTVMEHHHIHRHVHRHHFEVFDESQPTAPPVKAMAPPAPMLQFGGQTTSLLRRSELHSKAMDLSGGSTSKLRLRKAPSGSRLVPLVRP